MLDRELQRQAAYAARVLRWALTHEECATLSMELIAAVEKVRDANGEELAGLPIAIVNNSRYAAALASELS